MSDRGNPYIAGPPLREGRSFFGRQEIIEWVVQKLRNPNINSLVIFGQRRIGKTSLLLQLQRILTSDAFLPVYFDLQNQACRPLGQVLSALANRVARKAGLESPGAEDFDDQGQFFRNVFLPQLHQVLGEGRRLVFLLDEFDVLDHVAASEVSKIAANRTFFPFLQDMMADSRLAFLFAVGRQAEDLSLDYKATFKTSLAKQVWVLGRKSAEAVVRQAEVNGTLRFTDKAMARILSLTGKHPYLTQLLCQRLWERVYSVNPVAPPSVDEPDVDAAVSDALEAGESALVWIWDGLSPTERIYAAALAEIAEEGDTIPEGDVIRVLADHAARLRTRELELAPQDLVRRRVLEEIERQKYRFAVELFRHWVQQHKPLRTVKDELDRVYPIAEHLFNSGQGFFRQGQWAKSTQYFREALDENPRHFRAQLHLGEALLELKRIDEAVAELERAYELDQTEARYALARALVAEAQAREEREDEDGALAASERALQISPNERAAREIRDAIWTRRGNAALERRELKATPAFEELVATVGEDSDHVNAIDETGETPKQQRLPVLYAAGTECLRRQSWEEAVAIFTGLIQIDPGYKDVWQKLAEARERVRRLEDLEALYRASKVHIEKQQWEAACVYLTRIVDSGESYKDAADLLQEAEKRFKLHSLYAEAETQLVEENWEAVIKALEETIRIDRTYADSQAKLEQAREQYKLQSLYKQAQNHLDKERWSQAVDDLKTILEENPDYLDAATKLKEAQEQQNLAALYRDGVGFQVTGQWEDAIAKFREIISRTGVYKDVAVRLEETHKQQRLAKLLRLGENYLRQKKWKEAVQQFEEALEIDPNNRSIQVRLEETNERLRLEELRRRAEASFRAAKWQKAVETLEKLRELDPADAAIITRLEEARTQLELEKSYREGIKHLQKKRWRRAKNALENVIRLDPDYRDAATKLEIAQEGSRRSNLVLDILRDPIWQGIGVIIAIIIATSPYLIRVVGDLVKPTVIPKSSQPCNGDFESEFACWQHGGELDQAVECNGDGCFAVLGKPGYKCEGGVPVGEAWIKQSFQVPETVSPTLSLKYRILSYDILTNDLDNSDFFQVRINGKSTGEFGNTEWHKSDCTREAWDSDWQSVDFSLSPYRGERVELSLRNVNATEKWWNTWTYVDDIQVH